VLADLDHRPVVVVVNPPNEAFMLEARTSGLCRGMDAPFVGCLELEDDILVDESRDNLFEDPSSGERPVGGPLSLDRDLRGGIGERLRGHEAGGQE